MSAARWRVVLGVIGVVLIVVGLVAAGSLVTGSGPSSAEPEARSPGHASSPSPSGRSSGSARELTVRGDSAAAPVRVRIPALGISSRLDRLGLDRQGGLEKPPEWDVAGWYAGGPRPGATGPAVIAGHVDSPSGPAVFTGLDRIRAGQQIVVDDADGRHHTFTVDRTATTPKHGFPTRAVYGPTPDAQLRLITCSGPYDDSRGGYQDNLVVFARAT